MIDDVAPVRSALRGVWLRSKHRREALQNALCGKQINPLSGRACNHYKCAQCGTAHLMKGVQVDHIEPIGKLTNWDDYIQKLFCSPDNLQVLCKSCHAKKTKQDRTK